MPPRLPKTPLVFYRLSSGTEPVREWLKAMDPLDRRAVGLDLMRLQYRWPVGMPLCRALGQGLWEVRTTLPSLRIARVLFCFFEGELWALHGFIKQSRKTPLSDLEQARRRMRRLVA